MPTDPACPVMIADIRRTGRAAKPDPRIGERLRSFGPPPATLSYLNLFYPIRRPMIRVHLARETVATPPSLTR